MKRQKRNIFSRRIDHVETIKEIVSEELRRIKVEWLDGAKVEEPWFFQ